MSDEKTSLTKKELEKLKNPKTGRIAVNKIAWEIEKKDRLNKKKP